MTQYRKLLACSPFVALGQSTVDGQAQLEGVAEEQRDPCSSAVDEVT